MEQTDEEKLAAIEVELNQIASRQRTLWNERRLIKSKVNGKPQKPGRTSAKRLTSLPAGADRGLMALGLFASGADIRAVHRELPAHYTYSRTKGLLSRAAMRSVKGLAARTVIDEINALTPYTRSIPDEKMKLTPEAAAIVLRSLDEAV